MIQLYNSLSRKKEEFKPLHGKKVGLYTCGPTVYDHAHIGNLRSYIFADVLRRILESNRLEVHWVMNITDVDDKTIKRTIDEFGNDATPEDLKTYTNRYIEAFLKDLAEINIPEKSIKFIKVSDTIPEIIHFIKELIEKGYAYKANDGSTYFSIERYEKDFGDYGALVGKDFLKGKKIGARVKSDEYEKENLSDFALWKAMGSDDAKIYWDDPELGPGRPGWHVECSVINYVAFRGEPTDIHTGGVDLIFPHHTNEIAQSQPVYHPFVRCWVHCEHLLVNNHKMAKRERNFYTIEDLKKETPDAGLAFRYLTLLTYYRKQMNFTIEALRAAQSGLSYLSRLRFGEPHPDIPNETYEEAFQSDLNDDLNTASALSVLTQLLGYKDVGDRADKMADTLGIRFLEKYKNIEIPDTIQELAQKREKYRTSKQFIQSDRLRKEINDLGYEIEDTPRGPFLWPKL